MGDKIILHCCTCEREQELKIGVASGIICGKCGGSRLEIEGGCSQYTLTCPKCKKEFFVNRGEAFDCREFSHCGLHIFSFSFNNSSIGISKSITDIPKLNQPKKNNILSLPLSLQEITLIKNSFSDEIKAKKKIGIVVSPEHNHKVYDQHNELISILSKRYHVFVFDDRNFNQIELIKLNECDLVIGQYTNIMKNALILHLPTIILHAEVNIPFNAEVCLFGLKKADLSLLVQQVDDILSTPSMSYCIVTCNNKAKAIECLDAIFRYRRANEEVVIVDNASIDGLGEYLNKTRYNTQIIYNNKNIGCILARNQAMKAARGRSLLVLDSDQVISANTVHNIRLCRADIVGTEAWIVSKAGVTQKVGINDKFDYVGAGGMFLSKQLAETMQYFDDQFAPCYYEDVDFSLRARERGYSIQCCDTNITHHGPSMSSVMGKEAEIVKERSRQKFIMKWNQETKKAMAVSTRPQILMLVDVSGWAWDVKAQNIKKHLADDYNIYIRYQHEYGDFITDNFDLYFVFDCVYVRRLAGKASEKIIGGVTAHTYVNFEGYKELLKRCGTVHANSMMLYNELKLINSNAFYVPNGVDIDLFRFVEMDIAKEFTVGYVGKSHDRKGFNNFVVPACKKAGVKLKAQTAKYNDKEKIEPCNMPAFYNDVDCIIIASDMDGTPNQLLEAAAIGRAFVGVNIGNVPEFHNIDNSNGFLVDRNIDKIAEKIEFLKINREACKWMGIEARKTIESGWTWEIQAQNYKKMFEAALNKK